MLGELVEELLATGAIRGAVEFIAELTCDDTT
jgi:hypothetical protein